MDIFRQILNGDQQPLGTPLGQVPGSFPQVSSLNEQDNTAFTPADNVKYVLSYFLKIPFLIVYYVLSTITYLLCVLKPLNHLSGFYQRKYKRISDRSTQLNYLMEMLANDSRKFHSRENQSNAVFNFETLYNLTSGTLSSEIVQGTYTDLLDICAEQCKFAIIYLHDPLYENSMEYVNGVLCTERFTNLVKKYQSLLWFGDVTTSEGLQIANALKSRQFPFLGVLCLTTGTKIELCGKLEGPLNQYSPNLLESFLAKAYPQLMQNRQQRQNVAMERLIREQQDSRYQQSLSQDQEADRRRAAEQARENTERTNARLKQQWLLWRQSQLHSEPAPGTHSSNIAIRIQGGGRLIRRFDASLPIEEIYAYVELYINEMLTTSSEGQNTILPPAGYHHVYEFKLLTPAPRKELDPMEIISDENTIYPSGSVVVEFIDEN